MLYDKFYITIQNWPKTSSIWIIKIFISTVWQFQAAMAVQLLLGSSIYMWAYTGENSFSSSPSKKIPGVISHTVLKGGVQGFIKKRLLEWWNIILKISM